MKAKIIKSGVASFVDAKEKEIAFVKGCSRIVFKVSPTKAVSFGNVKKVAFSRGVRSLANLTGRIHTPSFMFRSDASAIHSDWAKIGGDLYAAMDKYNKK